VKLLFLCENVENSPVSQCLFYGRNEHGHEIIASFELGVNMPFGIFYLITQRNETIVNGDKYDKKDEDNNDDNYPYNQLKPRAYQKTYCLVL
jgi:hypothetical protein